MYRLHLPIKCGKKEQKKQRERETDTNHRITTGTTKKKNET